MAYSRIIYGLLVCLLHQSSLTLASIKVPFFGSMTLGRTFDYSKSKVGNDIFTDKVIEKATETRADKSDMKFKLVKSSEDVKDVLDVSGQLSVQIMAGTVTIAGKGKYVKQSTESGNSISVLAQIRYRTKTKTLTDDLSPKANWQTGKVDGRHYIRSVTYGGFLIVSLTFTAKENSNKEQIKAEVEANLNTAKLEVGVKGQFEKLAESAKDISTLKFSLSSTVIPDSSPDSLEKMLEEIKNFPSKIKNDGVAIEAELRELYYLENGEALSFVLNSYLGGKLNMLASMYHDLTITMTTIDVLTLKYMGNRKNRGKEQTYADFRTRVDNVKTQFTGVIGSIDLNGETAQEDQFDGAFSAYKEGKEDFLPGKFARELDRLQIAHPLVSLKRAEKKLAKKYKKKVKAMEGDITGIGNNIKSFGNLLSGNEVGITFPQQGVADYMINKGAPELDSVMACFSAKTNTQTNLHLLSYAVTGANNEFSISKDGNDMKVSVKGSTKDMGNLNMNDGNWHSWCIYWDDTGTTKAFKDGSEAASHTGLSTGSKITAGGTWVVGQRQGSVGGGFVLADSFTGSITNVNVYGNFNKNAFQRTVAKALTSKKCQPIHNQKMIKSWNDFKLGVVGASMQVGGGSCPANVYSR